MSNRVPLMATLAALALAGCSSQNSSGGEWTQVYDMVSGQFDSHTGDITLEQAAAVPFASLGVRIGDGPQVMVVLAADEAGDHLWTSKARIAVTTRFGRVVRTSGLPVNIDSVNFNGEDPVQTAARGGATVEMLRYSDFWDLNRFSVPLRCLYVSKGPDPVTILGKSISATRVEETCESTTMEWTFTDTYWVGSSGLVWKSIQHYHPNAEPLELELLRPPSRPG